MGCGLLAAGLGGEEPWERLTTDLRFLHLKIFILKRHSCTKCPTSLHSPRAFTSCPRLLTLHSFEPIPRAKQGSLGHGASGCMTNMGGGWEGIQVPRGPRAGQVGWGCPGPSRSRRLPEAFNLGNEKRDLMSPGNWPNPSGLFLMENSRVSEPAAERAPVPDARRKGRAAS